MVVDLPGGPPSSSPLLLVSLQRVDLGVQLSMRGGASLPIKGLPGPLDVDWTGLEAGPSLPLLLVSLQGERSKSRRFAQLASTAGPSSLLLESLYETRSFGLGAGVT